MRLQICAFIVAVAAVAEVRQGSAFSVPSPALALTFPLLPQGAEELVGAPGKVLISLEC
jgi:hypothetical protein